MPEVLFLALQSLCNFKTYDCSKKTWKASWRSYRRKIQFRIWGEFSVYTKKVLSKYKSYAIVDDLLATGGTVNSISKILKSVNKEITGLLVVVELEDLKGRFKLDFPVKSQIKF